MNHTNSYILRIEHLRAARRSERRRICWQFKLHSACNYKEVPNPCFWRKIEK